MARKPWHHQDKTAAERGYDHAWVKRRNRIKVRDKGRCQPCERLGRITPSTEVDHIKPKAQGGTDDDDNLQCICGPCHAVKTEAERLHGAGFDRPVILNADGRVNWSDR